MMETGILAKALYTNTPEAKSELFFRKGDILTVIEFDYEAQAGWWLCSLRGEKGLCPGNYLQLLKEGEYAPIYSNQIEDDEAQQTYDVPRSHNAAPVESVTLTEPDFYDVPRYVKSLDTRSTTRSPSQCCGSEISIMSSGTLSHYSSSSSSASARSSELCDVTVLGNNLRNTSANGNSSNCGSSIGQKHQSFGGTASLRSSGISSDCPEESYDVPRVGNGNEARYSKSSSSALTDDSIDVYDVPRSSEELRRAQNETPGLVERIQLRNKPSTASSAANRRAQFVSDRDGKSLGFGFGNSTTSLPASKLSLSSNPFSYSTDNCDGRQSFPGKTFSVPYGSGAGPRRPPSSVCSSSDTISICSAGNTDFRKIKHRDSAIGTTASQDSLGAADIKTLPLTPKAAVSVCEKMRQEVVTGVNSVLIFVRPGWRAKANLVDIMPDLRFGCIRLNLAIKDFAEFCSRVVSNAKKLGNDILIAKMRRHLTPINTSSQIIQQSVEELEAYFWSADRLSMTEVEENTTTDALNHLVHCSRNLSHHVKEILNFLAVNSTALFKEEQASVQVPREIVDELPPDDGDYDYVVLNSSKPRLPSLQAPPPPRLQSKDIQLLEFYSDHISTIGPLLSQSISTFISSIQQNDPPKVFNGHLKYVILLAYKLLFAGDTVHRNVINSDIKAEVEAKADELHKSILELHEMSKIATKHFPKILPMERIIEHVWATTAAASQLKKVIFSATCN